MSTELNDLDAYLPQDFNPETHKGEDKYEALPAGWYTVQIQSTEIKDTKAGTGKYLSVGFSVTAPRLEGRWVFELYNLKNPNEEAVRIGIEQFARLCIACGISGRPKSISELEGKRLDVKLKVERDDEYGDKNRISVYAKASSKVKSQGVTGEGIEYNDSDVPF